MKYQRQKLVPSFILFILLCRVSSFSQVVHYKLDKNLDNELLIQSERTNAHLGNIIGDLTFVKDRFGNRCRALEFSGKGYIQVPHSDDLNFSTGAAFSASVWFKLPEDDFQIITLFRKGEKPEEMMISPAYRIQLTSNTVSLEKYLGKCLVAKMRSTSTA